MTVLSDWLHTCSRDHGSCQLNEPSEDPCFARILDVGESVGSTELRLRARSEVAIPCKYATLSHCWGGAAIPCLVEDKVGEYHRHIDLSTLPQTFQDAIQLTRRLGLRYLWIDSLCIVQDSHEDWLSQATLMGEVYRHCYLNISATKSGDPHGGLFSRRDPSSVTPIRLCLQQSSEDNEAVYYDVKDLFYPAWNKHVSQSVLCNRGWVVQERALASRVVHFTNEKLFWECRERQSCEDHPGSPLDAVQPYAVRCRMDFKLWSPFAESLVQMPRDKLLTENFQRYASMALQQQPWLDTNLSSDVEQKQHGQELFTPTHPVIKYWSKIVVSYASANLSRSDDRLLAIAGLARILSTRSQLWYVAGHWAHQLPRQLLWSFMSLVAKVNTEASIAPTWSWISVGRGGGLGELSPHPSLERNGVLELIKIRAIGDGKEDRVEDAQYAGNVVLKVQGRLLPVSVDVADWPVGSSRPEAAVSYWQGSTTNFPTGATFLVPVLFFRWNGELPSATPNALILESTSEQGRFRRVGTARIHPSVHLNTVSGQLYALGVDEGATATGEAESESTDTLEPDEASTVQITPEQELMNVSMDQFASGQVDNLVAQLQHTMTRKAKAPPTGSRADVIGKLMGPLKQAVSRGHRFTEHFNQLEPRRGSGSAVDGAGSATKEPARLTPYHEAQRLAPKAAVAPHYYLEYIEDATAERYGNFVFEIE